MALSLCSSSHVNTRRSGKSGKRIKKYVPPADEPKPYYGLSEIELDTELTATVDPVEFFDHKRQQRLLKLNAAKAKVEQETKDAQRSEAVSWRKDGEKLVSNMSTSLASFDRILLPYNDKKEMIIELNDIATEATTFHNYAYLCNYMSHKILRVVRNRAGLFKPLNSIQVVRWKFAVMKDILNWHKLQGLKYCKFCSITYSYKLSYVVPQLKAELRIVRHLLRIYQTHMGTDKPLLRRLEQRREECRIARKKLQLIRDTQQKCQYISQCKSIQHLNPRFCGHCGVIWVGGSINGVAHVKSISREDFTATLRPLEFEISMLFEEERVQLAKTEALELDRDTMYATTSHELSKHIQLWWVLVLAFKRYQWYNTRRDRSSFQLYIRRLLQMKREVDVLIIEPDIDLDMLMWRYADITSCVVEYVQRAQSWKHKRVQKVAFQFREKLLAAVATSREQKRLAALELIRNPPPLVPHPIEMKRVFRKRNLPDLTCCRPECHRRTFLTEERFNTHMGIHYAEDERKKKIDAANAAAKIVRDARELEVMARVDKSRKYVSEHRSDAHRLPRAITAQAAGEEKINGSSSATAPFSLELIPPGQRSSTGGGSGDDCTASVASDLDNGSLLSVNSRQHPMVGSFPSAINADHTANPTAAVTADDESSSSGSNLGFNILDVEDVDEFMALRAARLAPVQFVRDPAGMSAAMLRVDSSAEDGSVLAAGTGVMSGIATLLRYERSATLEYALEDGEEGGGVIPTTEVKQQEQAGESAAAAAKNSVLSSTIAVTTPNANNSSAVVCVSAIASSATAKPGLGTRLGKSLHYGSHLRMPELTWAPMPHIIALNRDANAGSMYALELVSKLGDVLGAPGVIPLDKSVIKLGTHDSCDVQLSVRGEARVSGKISDIHCILYCPMAALPPASKNVKSALSRGSPSKTIKSSFVSSSSSTSTSNRPEADDEEEDLRSASVLERTDDFVTIVDNKSLFGTYIVTSSGVRCVPSKLTAGLKLTAGMLVCIGVRRVDHDKLQQHSSGGGAEEKQRKLQPVALSAEEAGNACLVYRVRSFAQ